MTKYRLYIFRVLYQTYMKEGSSQFISFQPQLVQDIHNILQGEVRGQFKTYTVYSRGRSEVSSRYLYTPGAGQRLVQDIYILQGEVRGQFKISIYSRRRSEVSSRYLYTPGGGQRLVQDIYKLQGQVRGYCTNKFVSHRFIVYRATFESDQVSQQGGILEYAKKCATYSKMFICF